MLGGKQADAGGQRVSPSRGDLQRGPSILCFVFKFTRAPSPKIFWWCDATETAASHSYTRSAALSVPLARDLGRGEPQGSGLRTRRARGGRGTKNANPPIANARTTARARYWFFRVAAMTSGPEFEARRGSSRSADRQALPDDKGEICSTVKRALRSDCIARSADLFADFHS